MGQEIERKFLLCSNAWRGLAPGVLYRQGYLCSDKERTVRVRLIGGAEDQESQNDQESQKGRAVLTIKSGRSGPGLARAEFEYDVPYADGLFMLEHLAERPLIEKRRYRIPLDGLVWEVDEFMGDNAGLIVAELELEDETQGFARPDWLGEEVTDDPRYLNSQLARFPFKDWANAGQKAGRSRD